MGKKRHIDPKCPQTKGKTQPLENHKHKDPLNQSGCHVGDHHVKEKRLQRIWPKVNESHHGHRKV